MEQGERRRVLQQQQRYYDLRATEYDHWWNKTGSFAQESQTKREQWLIERKQALEWVQSKLESYQPKSVVELAVGTGNWTSLFLGCSSIEKVLAIDGSESMLALCKEKLSEHPQSRKLTLLQEYLLSFNSHYTKIDEDTPPAPADLCFIGYFLSHIPPEMMDRFLTDVVKARLLKPGGRLLFVDSKFRPSRKDDIHVAEMSQNQQSNYVEWRTLSSGERFPIVKVYHDGNQLESKLQELGFVGKVITTNEFILCGDFILL
ncbi:Four and a half LIM domains 3a [Balamuthia mandrillaris]